MILVDSCVWSEVLRRKPSGNSVHIEKMKELILENQITIIGPIRQEVLSGISSLEQFAKVRHHLSFFDDLLLDSRDYIFAAELSNHCRRNGIQGSSTDFLICATAHFRRLNIYTIDRDFEHFQRYFDFDLRLLDCKKF